jgi:tRNA pseudouridine38-40 synthase
MRYFKLTIAYDGTAYHGWQRQNNALAVQEVFENALFDLTGQKVTVQGCSRTDAGVHAREYVLSFELDSTISCRGIQFGMNSRLPDDIGVQRCEEVDENFHARYCCKGKEYIYIVHNSQFKNPFYKNTAYRSWYPIDERKLDKAAKYFVGTHDFKAMCSTDCTKENTVRTVHYFNVERNGELVKFTVSGDGFLYNMVRIMVGTLLYVNEGKIGEDEIPDILKSLDRTKAGKTVPPQGLYLNKVYYEGNDKLE